MFIENAYLKSQDLYASLTCNARNIFRTLLSYTYPDGVCCPSTNTLSHITGLTSNQIAEAKKELIQKGVLKVEIRQRQSNLYIFFELLGPKTLKAMEKEYVTEYLKRSQKILEKTPSGTDSKIEKVTKYISETDIISEMCLDTFPNLPFSDSDDMTDDDMISKQLYRTFLKRLIFEGLNLNDEIKLGQYFKQHEEEMKQLKHFKSVLPDRIRANIKSEILNQYESVSL